MSDETNVESGTSAGGTKASEIQAILEAERQRAADLERRHAEATEQLQTAHRSRFSAETEAAETGLAAAKAEADRLEGAYAEAMEAGDFKAAAKAQRALVAAEQRVASREARIAAVKEESERLKHAVAQDPNAGFSAAARAWMARNPEVHTDQRFRHRAIAAHHEALANGIPPDSDEYFALIDSRVRPGNKVAANVAAEEDTNREVPAASAPPSRPTASGASRAGSVRLTAEEVAIANMMFDHLPPTDRAKAYAEAKRARS